METGKFIPLFDPSPPSQPTRPSPVSGKQKKNTNEEMESKGKITMMIMNKWMNGKEMKENNISKHKKSCHEWNQKHYHMLNEVIFFLLLLEKLWNDNYKRK